MACAASFGAPGFQDQEPQELFREYRFWVACEADEELPHLLSYIGEDHIVIGSDYGHNDPSKEPDFVKNMRAREDVAPAVIEKILCDNPRRLLRFILIDSHAGS